MSNTAPAAHGGRRATPASEGRAATRRPGTVTELPGAPRFGAPVAAGVYAIAVLVLGYPALGGKFLVSLISDQYKAGYAFREFGASALRHTGGFPLWNPYLQGGVPYVAGMAGDIFYPTFLLRLVLPVDVAMTWSFIIHVFLAGLFTFVFLRAAGLGSLPALVGGLAYMMGGPIASYVAPGHDGKLYVSALFPLVLWLLLRGVRDGRRWAWGLLAIAIGLAVLSPHPQLLQYLLLVSGAFALFLAFADSGAGRLDRRVALRRLGLAFVALLIGGAIGAIQYMPVREYVAWSPRTAGGVSSGWEHAVSFSFPPEELINTVIPQFSGLLENYWGRNGLHFHSEYIGVVVLVLAGLAFGRSGSPVRRSFLWFWTGTAIGALLWSLGGFTPFYHLVYALIPGAKFFRAPSTFFFVFAFSVAVLTAIGVGRLMAGALSRRYLLGWAIAGAVLLLLGLSGGLVGFGTSIAAPERYDMVLANGGNVGAGTLRTVAFLAVALGLLFALIRGRMAPRIAGWALLALVALDLWSIERLYWRFSPPASVLYASNPAVEYVKRQPQPGRVLSLPLAPEPDVYRDPYLLLNGFMIHRVRQVLGSHGNELRRYQELVGMDQGYAPVLQPAVWRLLNARYLLTNVDSTVVPGFRRLVGPFKDAAGFTLYLYELPGENPYAWVAPAKVRAEDAEVLPLVRNPQFDPTRVAVFDVSAPVSAPGQLATLPAPVAVPVAVTSYEPGRVSLRLGAPAPAGSALLVSENYYPGWGAVVDGKPARIGRADYTLIGVELPTGARTLELTFRSRPYEIGKVITLSALLVAVMLAIGGVALDRRRRV